MIVTNIDTLIEKSSTLIETLDKYISGLAQHSMNWVDVLTLIFAFCAVVVSGFSIYQTYRSDKKNRESNEAIAKQMQDAENKRAEAAIDANLTANARIRWIQDVRQATVELITACYKYIESKSSEQQKAWEVVEEKKTLYTLYFGPDDDGSQEILANDLLDKKTNKGKNDQLVLFVDNLYSNLKKYHKNHSDIKTYEDKDFECASCESYNEECGEKVYSCVRSDYQVLFDDDDCKKRQTDIDIALKKYKAFEQDILTSLQKLSEIMRIYGKIEWNRAKEGK
jgi:hypothetical protein